jgi:hypothetical protein
MKKVLYPLLLVVGFCALMFGLTTLFHSSAGACPSSYPSCHDASLIETVCDPASSCYFSARQWWYDNCSLLLPC